MIWKSKTITTQDGCVLDQAVVDEKLEAFAPFFIPEDRLIFGGAKSLGKGGFGLVKTATLSLVGGSSGVPITVAVKILKADDWNVPPLRVAYRVAREMVVWSACKHQHILKFVGYSFSSDGTKAYLVSPLVKNGNIQHYLSKNDVGLQQRLEFVRDTLKGLQYLHSRNPPIVHGDLKSVGDAPAFISSTLHVVRNPIIAVGFRVFVSHFNPTLNVLVNDDLRAVLCDFGLSSTMENRKEELATALSFKGSPRWCSPEALVENLKTLKSDIWSWGCLVLEIMTGKRPYDDVKMEPSLVLRIGGAPGKRRKPEPNLLSSFPSGLVNLLWRCWEYKPERRPDVSACVGIDHSVRSHARGVPGWDTMWLDEWIMQFAVTLETAVQECISRAGMSPKMARNLCCVDSLSRAELQRDLKEVELLLNPNRSGKRLPRTTTDYLLLRQRTIRNELRQRAQWSTRPVFKRGKDPVYRILRIFFLLHGPMPVTRVQIGEYLRELHGLLKTVIAPLDPNNHQLTSSLATFELLVRHYPDGSHDPEVVDHLMEVYYIHHLQKGNYRLCFDVALQASQQYRRFSEANQAFLPCLADALDKAASCAEYLYEHETARPLLQEAIGVYRKLVGVDPKGKQVQIHEFKILLARTLVRYCHVVCRLGHELAAHWQKDALESLREAIKIYSTSRSFGQTGSAKYGEELEDALWSLAMLAKRRNDREEAAEAEMRLKRLHDEEQAS